MNRNSFKPKLDKIGELKAKALQIRIDTLKALAEAGSGHTGASLGLADVFTTLYFNEMMHDPQNPGWEERDRFLLSIGHVAPGYYTTLAHAGYFDVEELMTLRKLGSRLQGHPGIDHGLPGLESSSGSLGQGLSMAVGRALAGKADAKSWRVYCVMGDGELQEGAVWEAAMSAAHHQLDNLCAIVDRNSLQIDGPTSDVMEIEPLMDKWKAFGWHVVLCNGHEFESILDAFQQARKKTGMPTVILARTIMGKGVNSIENDYGWHGRPPSKDQLQQFLDELEKR